jgi:glutamate synthase (NADPH) small chain
MSEQIDQQNNTAEQPSMFQVVNEGFTTREAIEEAKRCLHCKIPQCKKGCPIENDIPDFVHELSMGNMGAAMSIINAKSNLPAICGRVCPHEKQCQGHCVLGKKGKPVQIGKLEQFIADFDTKMNLSREKLPQKTRGRVAVIGSGPAGLTVAGDLARQGFNVTIFEGQAEPGGVLMYGISPTAWWVRTMSPSTASSVLVTMPFLWARVPMCLRTWILPLVLRCMV